MSATRPMRMEHHNNLGGVNTDGEKVSVNRGIGQYIRITNLDATNNLEVSFNGGRDYHSIPPASPTMEVYALFHFIRVRSSASTVPYTAIFGAG